MNDFDGVQSYEWLRAALGDLSPAGASEDRLLVWADSGHTLGVARDALGRLEVFMVGDPLVPTNSVVADNLQHQVWMTRDGVSLPANRLVLAAAPHFDGVAAFICSELLANGAADDMTDAFHRSEEVIALALRRAALSDHALLGLAGELFVIARLVESLAGLAGHVIDGWFGSVPSSRDLQIGAIGVEIKTTSAPASVHHIQGLHQVERGMSVNGAPETHLFLLSIGAEWLGREEDSAMTIPGLVQRVLDSLTDVGQRRVFVDRVKQYGGDASIGYDHANHHGLQRFRRPFRTRFERLYDLDDDRLHLLRSRDVEEATAVETGSISYRVRLPSKVRGDLNPITGMTAILSHLRALLD